jgi:spore coat polysaccharide biosynthesis predicted glycosyltransferase SpsG/L-amino acid N-acyltransferase YncA
LKALLLADGGAALGAGHQVRSAALAAALAEAGHQTTLVCRDLPGSAHAWAWRGLTYECLSAEASLEALALDSIARHVPDVVVVDHYAADGSLLAALSARARVVVLDDLPGRELAPAALVANAAPGVRPRDYPGTPAALGPAHAPVRPQFRPPGAGAPRDGLLVAMGSSRNVALAEVLRTLHDGTQDGLEVVRGSHPVVEVPQRVRLHHDLDAGALADLMRRCRAGLLSASSIVFEAARCALRFAAVVTEPHQERLAAGLSALGVPVLGVADADAFTRAVETAAALGPRLRVDELSTARLASRVLEAAIETRAPRLRPLVWNDRDELLAWANDPAARQGSFETRPIAREEHEAWLEAKLMDPEARLFVAMEEGGAIGVLRLERARESATVSINVVPSARGRGAGRRMLAALQEWVERARFARRLVAFVRHDNAVSLRLFRGAGFEERARELRNGVEALRFERALA